MELKDLRCFVAIAETGGFRSASRRLGMEQSIVSRRLASLEDGLGVSLVERGRNGVRLTAAGGRFLEQVRTSLSQLDVAVSHAQAAGEAVAGRVRIGITSSIASGFVRELLAAWRTDHPRVAIDLVEGGPNEHVAAVLAHKLDLTFQLSSVPHQGLDAEQLWIDRVFAATASGSPYAAHGRCRMAQLADAEFIVSTRNSGPDIRDFLTTRLYQLGNSPSIRMIDIGREALMHCVGLGMGVTVTTSADATIRYPDVTFVEILDERLPFSAIWSPHNDNPALRRFLSGARIRARKSARPHREAPAND
ncbi:LysR family transcriptional regulator [Bradyrhizobium symbiodeficiens]|uniref:LysR family transcriptional regulator n=1 Tax=Bradyrhizobium symbiodeficiens TaxID=1404367 RepID=A0ABX5WAC5_9BRAD|nr:LysR family transcriptional regulator [Bradyrhizobium symbiodeficiens]QDF39168.1 LysR family transcriptional regulator [Bradyrhizobium symbiodeficiens]